MKNDGPPGPETRQTIVFTVAHHLAAVNDQFLSGQISVPEVFEQIMLMNLYLKRSQKESFGGES